MFKSSIVKYPKPRTILLRYRNFSSTSHTQKNLIKLPKVIIEEPVKYNNKVLQQYHDEIANYKADHKLPTNLKTQLINSKIESILQKNENQKETIDLIEFALTNSKSPIPLQTSISLFNSLYDQITKQKPQFLEPIVKSLLINIQTLPPKTLILLLDFISKQGKVEMIEIYNRIGVKFSDEFISEYLTFLSSSNKLVIKNFEDLVNFKINDTLVSQFNDYIEALFENHLPEVHCYENLEYSIDRIQLLINNILSKVNITSLSINSMLTLFKLNEEFLSVNRCEQSNESNSKLVRNLEAREKQFLEYVKNENMEESIVESLLCTLKLQNSSLLAPFTKPIQSNDKFSEILKFQAKIFVKNIKEEELLNHPKSLEISEDNFEKLISTISNTLPTLIQPVVEFYTNEGLELTPIIYKHILDQLIQKNHYHQAIKTFQESTQKVSWSESINNPTITKTLNDLIQCVCSNLPIRESFPLFQKIKANLNQQQINIDSINVLTSKMLDQNLVGDTIELLKRELPDLKNNLKKLPIDKSYGKKYLQLFNTIHDYVISNESDTTIKNNWYLFIQLYKYFNIPEPTILPTLKFFCSHKRWNSALLIFTKMCDLNQLHGHHNYPPPSKQIYSYLLKEFGDNLYEEGVIEIHDWLKMDTSIDSIGLELNNILMNSYCNLQDVSKVRDLFNSAFAANQINESSAIILLKAYTYNDLNYVEKFYNNLSQFGLEPNYEIYKQYIIAYAYYGQVEKAFELLEEEDEFEVNEDLLINLYNFCYIADQQVKIPELASERYPEIWSNVVSSGLLINSDGYTNEKFLVDGKEIKSIESIES